MYRKLIHWTVIVIFVAVLGLRIGQHYRYQRAKGFLVEIGRPSPPEDCELAPPRLILHIAADHALRFNQEPTTKKELTSRLHTILEERPHPLVYMEGYTGISMQEFAEILELALKSNDKVHIRIVTPENRKNTCLDAPPQPGA